MELEQFLPQLERQYKKWVKDRIAGQAFSPFALRGLGKPPEKLPELMATLRFFQSHEKNNEKLGWKILQLVHLLFTGLNDLRKQKSFSRTGTNFIKLFFSPELTKGLNKLDCLSQVGLFSQV